MAAARFIATNRNGIKHLTTDDGETAICGSTKHSGRVLPLPTSEGLVAFHHSACKTCVKRNPQALGFIKAEVGQREHEAIQEADRQLRQLARGTKVTIHPHVGYGYSVDTEPGLQPWDATFNCYQPRNGVVRVTEASGNVRDLRGNVMAVRTAPNGSVHLDY